MKKTLFIPLFLSLTVSLFGQKPELVLPVIHAKPINGMTCSLDGRYFVSTAYDDLKIWEASTGKLIRTIAAKEDQGFSMATISADGKWLIATTDPGWEENSPTKAQHLLVLDPISGKQVRLIHTFKAGHYISHIEINLKNSYVLAVVEENYNTHDSYVFDFKTGAQIRSFPGSGQFDDMGKDLVLLQDSVLTWVEIETGNIETVTDEPCFDAQKAGKLVTILTKKGRLKQWDTQTKMMAADFKLNLDPVYVEKIPSWSRDQAKISRDGARCAITVDAEHYRGDTLAPSVYWVFDAGSGKAIRDKSPIELQYFSNKIFSPDLRLLFEAPHEDVGSWENMIKAYSTADGKFSHVFGLASLDQIMRVNAYADTSDIQIFNQGKIIYFDGTRSLITTPSFVFFTETGRAEILEPADSLSAYVAKHSLRKDKRWTVKNDLISYQIIDAGTQKTVATLLIPEGRERTWAVTTPSGLFDASPDMMDSLHYVSGMEIIDLEQLKERYYEPGLLAKLFGLSQETARSVEAFNEVALYPDMTAQWSADKLKLQVDLTPRNGGIGKLSLFVNGKEVAEDTNPQRAKSVSIDLTAFSAYYLPNGPSKLALRVYNQAGWLKSAALELDYQPPATARGTQTAGNNEPVLKGKPGLFALVVGTADYAGEELDLKFADHDATSFTQALRAASPKVFGDKVSVTLLNTDATDKNRQDISSKTTIKKAFADIAAKAQAQDILVIYFSGHGVNYGAAESGQFYYLTKDIASENLGDPEIRNNYAISSTELTEWIKAIPALKQIMILDACNSGKIVEDLAAGRKDLNSSQIRALDRMKDRTGMFILTGSAADKVSYEAGQYGQGLLTYSLLQGMSGLALTEDKRVDVMTLFQYSRDRVPELAKGIGGIQTPILAFPANGASFDIGIVDAQVKIPLAQVKPVFIRNVFQDEDTFDDVLGLTPALAGYFQEITARGAQANLIYVDVPEYENAYSMKGRYKQSGDAVEVRGRLFKGKTAKGEFQVTGKKSDLPGLVEAIVEKVQGMIE